MTARAVIKDEWTQDRVAIGLATKVGPTGTIVVDFSNVTLRTVQHDEAVKADWEKYLTLPVDAARALYEELARYFGVAGGDILALRKDYDSERRRVDELLDAITTPLKSMGVKPVYPENKPMENP